MNPRSSPHKLIEGGKEELRIKERAQTRPKVGITLVIPRNREVERDPNSL